MLVKVIANEQPGQDTGAARQQPNRTVRDSSSI